MVGRYVIGVLLSFPLGEIRSVCKLTAGATERWPPLLVRQVEHATERVIIKGIGWVRLGTDMPPPSAVRRHRALSDGSAWPKLVTGGPTIFHIVLETQSSCQ